MSHLSTRQSLRLLGAFLVLIATTVCYPQPGESRSILDQFLPFGSAAPMVRGLIAQGGELVETLRNGASIAYEDLVSSLASGPPGKHPNNEINDNECTEQSSADGLCAPYDPDAHRNVSEIIRSRGFEAQEFDVTTRDGYILTIQRIVNPRVDANHRRKLKPVILQHGLMSSSVDWVINSVDVRPAQYPVPPNVSASTGSDNAADGASVNSIEGHHRAASVGDSQTQPNSLGFYLANEGYDVFLANSRGNVYGQRHVNMSSWQPAFWDFTFDEQIKYDLPDVIEFVQKLTGHKKLGYVGHSQGTTMALGLLADQPDYADVLEPVVLLAPVAYVNHCLSPVRYFAVYTPIFQHINMWFASSNVAVRYLGPLVCGPKVIRRDICANIIFLSTGFDESEFNDTRVSAYLAHMPSGTSVKNIAHWGQEVISGRFAHFNHGILGNQARYGQAHAPDYDIKRIRSKSLALFTAENDWLASPKDVARLRAELQVPVHKVVNVTESMAAWNHIDFLYGKDAGRFVNPHIVEVFHNFDQ